MQVGVLYYSFYPDLKQKGVVLLLDIELFADAKSGTYYTFTFLGKDKVINLVSSETSFPLYFEKVE